MQDLLQNIPGSGDANANDLDESLQADDNDHQIIQMVLEEAGNIEDESEGEGDQSVSHSDAAGAFDFALRYEQQSSFWDVGIILFQKRGLIFSTTKLTDF